jgi:hypothetical protein
MEETEGIRDSFSVLELEKWPVPGAAIKPSVERRDCLGLVAGQSGANLVGQGSRGSKNNMLGNLGRVEMRQIAS